MIARAATLMLLAVLAAGPTGAAPPVTVRPVTVPPITAPPVTVPPVTVPPVTAPPLSVPPTDNNVTKGLPVPPVSPRIAEGPDYDHCLAMLYDDPDGASTFADTWASSGGGDGATHCQALAQIELGNAETGADSLEKLASTTKAPDLTRAALYGQAVQAWLMANKPDHAFEAATLALALSPNDPDLLIDRAVTEGKLDHFHEAIDDLNRALAIAPNRAEAFVLRASAWRHLDNLDVASSDVERALAINPDSSEALLERGILRQRTGNPTGAREDWQRAINLDPNSETADLAEQDLALLAAGPGQQ